MSNTSLSSLHKLIWTALCASLVAVGAFLNIPFGSVPFSLQPLFVLLSGFILGPVYGPASIVLYLIAGTIGLPVFAGGKSGLAHLLGPTGGFLFGFILASCITGISVKSKDPSDPDWIEGVILGFVALCFLYLPGLIWLKAKLDYTWLKVITMGFIPFFPSDTLKIVLALALAKLLRTRHLVPL